MSLQTKYPKESILGIELDNVSLYQAINEITRLAKTKQSHYIVKPYVEFFDKTNHTAQIKKIMNSAYLCLPDGVSLNWAAYYKNKTKKRRRDVLTSLLKIIFSPDELHKALPNHSWGTDFTWKLLEHAKQNKLTVFLVGSPKKSSITSTKSFLQKHIPGLEIVGTFNGRDGRVGYFTDAMEVDLGKQIATLRPDIILLGLGFPVQEKVISRLARNQTHGIFIGEGGTFDFKSFGGTLPKAPVFMQRVGLEWLWRLFVEPHRLKRQLAIPKFIAGVYRFYRRDAIAKTKD